MAGPWEDYAPQEDGPWTEYAAAAVQPAPAPIDPLAKYKSMSFMDKLKADASTIGQHLAAPVRGVIKGVTAFPGLAADLGVGTRNLLTGSNYQLPSQGFNQALDQTIPAPNVPGAQEVELGASLATGLKLPAPQVKNTVPAGFVKPSQDFVRQQTLANSRQVGYVVPPSTTNPTVANKVMESIGGKIATAQDAAARNQNVTNTLAKKALGLSDDAPLTEGALSALRKEAGDAYQTLRGAGATNIDQAATKQLDDLAAKFSGSKLKEALGGGNDIPKIVQALKDEPLTGDTAVDVIDLLRGKADVAYRAGDKMIGKGYKQIAETVERVMEGKLSGEALKKFRDARQLIAKSYSVEGAFNPSTGNVSAQKLATQLAKRKPLSGELKTAAQFGQAFPKAAQEVVDSGSVRNTDVALGAVTSVLDKQPAWLMYPFARQAMRAYLLGPGQPKPISAGASQLPPELLNALLAGGQTLRGQ